MTASARTIVLGFDGLDPRLCRKWMSAGDLPNFSSLAASGSFSDLNTTCPCQSPVAWRTVITGVNPGGHGIFDFLRRAPGTYLPTFAAVEEGRMQLLGGRGGRVGISAGVGIAGGLAALGAGKAACLSRRRFLGLGVGISTALALGSGPTMASWLPEAVPMPVNRTGGTPFWSDTGACGVRTKALRVPAEFPPRAYKNCKVLSGLGVPDIRATNGTYTLFTEEGEASHPDTEMGGRVAKLTFSSGIARTDLLGPPNPLGPGAMRIDLAVQKTGSGVDLQFAGKTVPLAEGEWTDWIEISFSASPFVNVSGLGRFHLLSRDPVSIYLAPVNLNPADLSPNMRITSPPDYAEDLARGNEKMKTLGWPTDTWAISERHIPDEVYLQDYRETMQQEKALCLSQLAEEDWDCFFHVFTPTDQIQHVFADSLSEDENPIRSAYQEVDTFLGQVMHGYLDDRTTLVVMSDHGFHPFRRAVNLNTWLWKNGYLSFKGEVLPAGRGRSVRDLTSGASCWEGVDWQNTYAYSMGLGNIYLNLRGREPSGIVKPGPMADKVVQKVTEGLLALRDHEGDRPVMRSVYRGADLYAGKYARNAADVMVGFHPGWRVSWQTALGGIPKEIIEPNPKAWRGDHCSIDPAVTPGILLTNQKIKERSTKARASGAGAFPSLVDIAPSVMSSFDLKRVERMEGEALWA